MMRWIVGSSLKFRGLVVAIAAGLLVLGITQVDDTRMDVLPEFRGPTVEVQTEALGLSAEEVEQLVTVPLEQDLLNGVAFLEDIESASLPGLSSVVMTFEPGTDILDARQVVAERLTQAVAAAGLPQVAGPPQMLQPLSATSRLAMVKLSSAGLSPIEMSVLARWVIVPRLLGVEGVANVAIWGFRDRQLQVLVEPDRLRNAGVTLSEVVRTAGNALEVSPLSFLEASKPGTGGWIDTVNQRLHIFHEQTINTPDELAQVPMEDSDGRAVLVQGEPLILGDVTEVVEDHQPLIGDALCSDGQCLLLVVEKFPDANTPEVTDELEDALDVMAPGLPGMEMDTSIYRPASYIEESAGNLGLALLIGGILLVLLLGAFFFEWRMALISAVAILLSLVAAGMVLNLGGVTVNTMILAGLAMALVVVIDDAVVGVDHLAWRLRERRADAGGAPVWRTIIDASLEMRRPIFYATLIVVAALVTVFFTEGTADAFLPPIALSYMLAVVVSMVVALTVTPVLGMLLLARAPLERRESPVVVALRRAYQRVAPRIVPRPRPAFLAVAVLAVAGFVALPFLHPSLRPSLKERDILVHMEAPPGTSLQRTDRLVARAVDELAALPGVQGVGAHVGRAVTSDQIVNVNSGEMWVTVDPSADYDATVAAIEESVGRQSELSHDVLTYSEQRVTQVLEGSDEDIVVRVYGEDPAVLRDKAEEVRGLISGIEGVDRPRLALPPQEPVIEVEVDLERAERYGAKPGDIRRAAAVLLSGLTVGQLFEEQKVFDVVVWGAPEIRRNEADVQQLRVDTPGGLHVPLGAVADVRTVPNTAVIRHESVVRFLDVTAAVAGRDAASVAADVDRAIARVEFPLDHHAELLGGAAEESAARTRLLTVGLAAAILAFLLLQTAFKSWRLAILVFATLPVALVGGALAALLAGGTIGLGSIAGFFAVLGLAARGSLLLIQHYQHLERDEDQPFGADLVIRGTRDRVGPILLTALAAAAVLGTFMIAGTVAGLEIIQPMAVVIFGGLITTTALHLVILPALYLRYGFVAERDTFAEEMDVTIPEIDTVPPVREGS